MAWVRRTAEVGAALPYWGTEVTVMETTTTIRVTSEHGEGTMELERDGQPALKKTWREGEPGVRVVEGHGDPTAASLLLKALEVHYEINPDTV